MVVGRVIGKAIGPLAVFVLVATAGPRGLTVPVPLAPPSDSPIQHVVIIDQENHSFDDLLGKFCAAVNQGLLVRNGFGDGCDGATVGTLPGGTHYPLTAEPDFGLNVAHNVAAQKRAIDGGLMDGFATQNGCRPTSDPAYGCLSQFDALGGTCGLSGDQTCIPNAVALARQFAISDRTFELGATPSWAGHMILGSATLQNFVGDNPKDKPLGTKPAPGWGCDSGKTTAWQVSANRRTQVPACVPDATGSLGPIWNGTKYSGQTHAAYVPTIFDRMDGAGVSWKIYGGGGGPGTHQSPSGYGWTICPTFWECLGSQQGTNLVPNSQIFQDAASGQLPAVSFVTPVQKFSEHQPASVSQGDGWVGSVIASLMSSQDWGSMAIFLTWDDCGCFYDHVNPLQYNAEWGVRVPMIIISPFAKPGYTDSIPATFTSLLAYLEHNFGLQPLNPCATIGAADPACTDDLQGPNNQPAYDYAGAFSFAQAPVAPVKMTTTWIPPAERAWLRAHPDAGGGET